MQMQVRADAVMEGDFIPGLDNGYVVESEHGGVSYGGFLLPNDTVALTYHDADGEECYLLLPGDSLLTVERP